MTIDWPDCQHDPCDVCGEHRPPHPDSIIEACADCFENDDYVALIEKLCRIGQTSSKTDYLPDKYPRGIRAGTVTTKRCPECDGLLIGSGSREYWCPDCATDYIA